MSKITWTELKKRNAAAGRFYWSEGAVEFFRSRNEGEPFAGRGGVFFVVSIQGKGSDGKLWPRQYKVCEFVIDTSEVRAITVTSELSRGGALILAGKLASDDGAIAKAEALEEADGITPEDLQAATARTAYGPQWWRLHELVGGHPHIYGRWTGQTPCTGQYRITVDGFGVGAVEGDSIEEAAGLMIQTIQAAV